MLNQTSSKELPRNYIISPKRSLHRIHRASNKLRKSKFSSISGAFDNQIEKILKEIKENKGDADKNKLIFTESSFYIIKYILNKINMQKNKNNLPQLIITINTLKNIDTLIKRLKDSLKLQKAFLSEIDNKFSSFLKKQKKDKNEIAFIDELMSVLPRIISELGIPFVYHLMTQENIMEKFINLFYDRYEKKVSEIFEICLKIFNFSLYYDYINKLKHYLIEIGIIQNKEETQNNNSSMNHEEILFERISYLLNELNQLKDIGIDKENILKLENDHSDILKEIKNLPQKIEITPAKIEFYKELIKPYSDYLKTINTNKNCNNITNEKKLNIFIFNLLLSTILQK
jgi:hypothetical protein